MHNSYSALSISAIQSKAKKVDMGVGMILCEDNMPFYFIEHGCNSFVRLQMA